MIFILLLLAIIIVLLSGSYFPRLNGFSSCLEVHDLVRALVELCQRLALIFLEFIPKRGVKSYPRDCYHHHPILLRLVYCRQLIVETLNICLQCVIWSLLNAIKAA